jgi:hypothetical protein
MDCHDRIWGTLVYENPSHTSPVDPRPRDQVLHALGKGVRRSALNLHEGTKTSLLEMLRAREIVRCSAAELRYPVWKQEVQEDAQTLGGALVG